MLNKQTTQRLTTTALLMVMTIGTGCGLLSFRNPDFDNAETGDDGQTFLLDDLEAIAADPDLTDEEKRDAFEELGVEDQDLIDALLG